MVEELVEVRCPFETVHKPSGKVYACPQVVVKVIPGSKGEGWCRRHRKAFDFEVDLQSNYRPKVTVQK